MRICFALCLVISVLIMGCGVGGESVEPVRSGPSKIYTMDQLVKTVSVGGGSFNPDETKLLVHTNETGVFNVYELDLATGERTAVTEGEDTTFAVAYMPNDETNPLHPGFGGQRGPPPLPARARRHRAGPHRGRGDPRNLRRFLARSPEFLHRQQPSRSAFPRCLRVGCRHTRVASDLREHRGSPTRRESAPTSVGSSWSNRTPPTTAIS